MVNKAPRFTVRNFGKALANPLYSLFVVLNGGDRRLATIQAARWKRLLRRKKWAIEELEEFRPHCCWQPEKVACVLDWVRRTEGLDGDIVELGCYQGGGTLLMAEALRGMDSSRTIWSFDSFEGFPEVLTEDRAENGECHATEERFCDTSARAVKETMRFFGVGGYVQIVEGDFVDTAPETFAETDRTFSLVIIDCDVYAGAKFCLEYFVPRVMQGGIIVVDDYGVPGQLDSSTYPGVRRAVDEYLGDDTGRLFHGARSMWYMMKE